MHTRLACAASLMSLAASLPALAQSAADRVDAARVEERSPTEKPTRQDDAVLPLRIEYTKLDGPDLGFTVGAVDIVGLQVMSRAHFADIVQDYIGRSLTPSQLTELTERLAVRARGAFPLAAVTIEPQDLRAGVLRVRIDEGTIDEVRIDGPQNSSVLAALRTLASGKPASATDLERRLLLAGDIDGVTLGRPRIVRENGRNILVVKMTYRRFRAQVTLDNDSTSPAGPLELIASARFNGVLASDDSLSLLVLNAVPQVTETSYLRARYKKRLNASGTEASLTGTYSRSVPGSYLRPLDLESTSWFASFGLQHPLLRSRRSSLWIEGTFSHRELRRERANIETRNDKLTVVKAGVLGFTTLVGGRLAGSVSLARGVDLLGATRAGDPLASRNDADATFKTLSLSADWSRTIVDGLGVKLGVRVQRASQPLLLAEEIGIGGATFGRGYDYSERSGDQGVMGYAELAYKWDKRVGPLNGIEVYGFADGGKVTNLGSGFGGGTLYSSGAGVRADVDRRTDATFEVAVPLSGPRYESDDKRARLRFSLSRYF